MAEDQKTEDRYRQLQMIQQQAEQIAEYVQKLQMQLQEIDNSLEALQELKNTAINTEILAPVANGIFLKASLQDNQKLVVNVGAEVTVEKTIPEVINLLQEQKEKITQNVSEAEGVLQELQEHVRRVYQEMGEAQ
ncbi:MAG TPA: prefoldin subunit alpha [Candidatus Nanoarchaeia archaeon]|nr:prefoldin subunit alpha [Candidatus Nanoarchaeia archaeon]